jgi:hypothetical protein
MATALRVEAAVPGRRRAGTADHALAIDQPAGPIALRDLIAAVVRAEVAAFRRRAEEQTFVRVLTEASLAADLATGTVRTGARHTPAEVDDEEAVATALLAFEDGLYRVLVDDEPVDRLDATIDLHDGTRLLFLRLVALAGG